MKNLNIKSKLISLISLVALILVFLTVIIYSSLSKVESMRMLSKESLQIEIKMLKLRKAEKDFLLRSIVDEKYFKTNQSVYINQFENLMTEIMSDLNKIERDENILDFQIAPQVSNCKQLFETYHQNFKSLVNLYTERGFHNYGLVGEMRSTIKEIEKQAENKTILAQILFIRKTEKDYLLLQNKNLLLEMGKLVNHLSTEIQTDKSSSENFKKKAIEALPTYLSLFEKIVQCDEKIGFTEKDGVISELRATIHQVEPLVEGIVSHLEKETKDLSNKIIIKLIFILFILLSVLIFILLRLMTYITESINSAQIVVQKVAKGDFSSVIRNENLDEIGLLMLDLKAMQDAMIESTGFVQKVAKGDLTIKFKPRSDKDYLLIALSEMLIRLNEVVGQVVEATENIAGGSLEMSEMANQIAQGANEQAASTEEVSASIEEMTTSIQQNSENAIQTEKMSRISAQSINDIYLASEKSIAAMKDIVDKIDIVNDIAEKTDILAINAAIEAARAGDHGKGFGVVAAEIRKLAETSQKSAKMINELTKSSLKTIEESGKMMQQIIPDVKKTAQLVQEITAASSEQSSGSNQIAKAMDQLSQVVQQNSAAAEEMSAGSEELAGQSEILRNIVQYFTIETGKPIKKTLKRQVTKSSFNISKRSGIQLNMNESLDNEFERI